MRYKQVVKVIDEKHRLVVMPDECSSFDDLAGDTYNREANPYIPEDQMVREEKAERKRINDEGVWGLIGEYRCPCCREWIQADAVWGFIGNDWEESGYDTDIESATKTARTEAIARVVAMGEGVTNA